MDKFLNKVTDGDSLELLKELPDGCIQTCVTSPPYWGLRDYNVTASLWGGNPRCSHVFQKAFCEYCGAWQGALGLEPTPELYVEHVALIFSEVRRVLRDNGTLWLNLGDTYFGSQCGRNKYRTLKSHSISNPRVHNGPRPQNTLRHEYLKAKDECDIPFLVKLALKQDGWFARQTIIWERPNCMPESVKDRPTKSHEYIFLMAKSKRYYFDSDPIRTPYKRDIRKNTVSQGSPKYQVPVNPSNEVQTISSKGSERWPNPKGSNPRSVWEIAITPFKGGHFAVYPSELAEKCILAGAPEQGIVLDPFMGSGTTALAAIKLNRQFIGFEVNPSYCSMSNQRISEARAEPEQFYLNLKENI